MAKHTQEGSIKKKKNSANIEQMCGILLLVMQENKDIKVGRELEGVLKNIRGAEPCGTLEVRRIDKEIISKLRRINDLVSEPDSAQRIKDIAADIGLLLLQRSVKVDD